MDKTFITNLLLAFVAMTTLHLVSPHWTSHHNKPKHGNYGNPCHGVYKNTTVTTPQGKVFCMVPTEEELSEQVKSVGGYNKHYVARTEQEADDFENILPWDGAATTQTLHQHGNGNDPNFNLRRRRSKRKPNAKGFPLKDVEDDLVDKSTRLSSSSNWAAQLLRGKRTRSQGSVARSTKVDCIAKGQKVGRQKYTQMCAVCQRKTELKRDRFPRFINELTCETQHGVPTSGTNQCEYKGYSIGTCVQGSMVVDLLRSTNKYTSVTVPSGDYFKAYKQIWVPYTQEIRSCCECAY